MTDQPDEDEQPQTESALQPLLEAGADITAGGIGAILGGLVAGPIGLGLGFAAGPAIVGAAKATEIAIRKRINNRARVISNAADQRGVTIDELIARAAASPAHAELLARVLDAAGESVLPGKIEALAQVLADGSDAPTQDLDTPLAVASALRDLEGPSLRILQLVGRDGARPKDEDPDPWTGEIGISRERLSTVLADDARLQTGALRTLELHGLIRDDILGTLGGLQGDVRYVVTDFGRDLLLLLGESDLPSVPAPRRFRQQ